ncbi:MAG: hypothetical protein Q8Q06_04280 [bacterium]|nr:hypothetical protein [bacterium]
MFWTWFWFVLFVIALIANQSMEDSFKNKLKTIKHILEDTTNTFEGKIASTKILVDQFLKE